MSKPIINSFDALAPLVVQKYESYLPTAFDESMTILEKMNKIIQYLNSMGLLVNSVVKQWNEVMEWVMNDGLDQAVSDKLDEMVEDGTLADLINVVIFGELNARIDELEKLKSNAVNIEEAGVIADAKQINYTYQNTGTALDGQTRKIWISEGNNGESNRLIIQSLLDQGKNLFIPNGDFYLNPKTYLVIKKSGLRVTGSNLLGSRLIGASFNALKEDNLSDLDFDNFTMEGIADVTPPKPLKIPTDPTFNPANHYDIYDDQSFVFIDGEYKSNSQWGAIVYGVDLSKQVGDVFVRRVKFKNYQSGVIFGNRTDTDTTVRPKNVKIEKCIFDNIVFQSVGANNVFDIETEGCYFINNYFQPIDYSRGNKKCRILNNTFENCATLGKTEGFVNGENRVLADDFLIKGNRFINPPNSSSVHFEESFIISNLTGDGKVTGNIFDVSNRHTCVARISSKYNTRNEIIDLTDNEIRVNGSKNPSFAMVNVIKYNDIVEAKGLNLTIENNVVRHDANNVDFYFVTNFGKLFNLYIKKNRTVNKTNLVNNYNRLYDGFYVENEMCIEKNTITNIMGALINLVTTDLTTTNVLDFKNNKISYLPTASLISTRMIINTNATANTSLIRTLNISDNKTNFPNLVYLNKLDVNYAFVDNNKIYVESNSTNIGQSTPIYHSTSYTKEISMTGNKINKTVSQLTFNLIYLTATASTNKVLVKNNEVTDLESVLRVLNNVGYTYKLLIQNNYFDALNTMTLLIMDNGNTISKGYLVGNVLEAQTLNIPYFSKIKQNGNIFDAVTLNESGKVA